MQRPLVYTGNGLAKDVQSLSCFPRRRRSIAPGFTLVELLVVIGIIVILIALLMPALSGARRQAQLTQCLSIQRQIALAANMHASQHQGYYPIAGDLDGVPDTLGVTGVPPHSVGDVGRRKYMYVDINESFMRGTTLAPWHAALATYMGKKTALDGADNKQYLEDEIGAKSYLKYFICPSHKDEAAEVPNSMIYEGGNLIWMLQQSYVVNEAVFGINDRLGRLRGKASRIRQPARTVMLTDGLQSGMRPLSWSMRDVNWVTFVNLVPTPPITLADAYLANGRAGDAECFDKKRHRGRLNVLFCDGHAETRRIETGELRNIYLLAN